MMTELPPFPEVIDSTMRSALVACPRQFYYSHLLHLRRNTGKSVHLHFGGCVAKGLEVVRRGYWQDGLDEVNALASGVTALILEWGNYELPPEVENSRSKVKDLAGCVDAIVSYFEHHQLGNDPIRPLMLDGHAAIENTFSRELPGVIHPTTGKPIMYAGRFDMLGVYQDAVFVVDEKTSLNLGPQWRSNWLLQGQLTGYCWGAPVLLPEGQETAGAIVRGIGILGGNISFEQAILSRPRWQIDAWLRQVTHDVERAIELYQMMLHVFRNEPHKGWDQALDAACSAYGGCSYTPLCDSPDPRHWYDDYSVKPWNPLDRGDGES